MPHESTAWQAKRAGMPAWDGGKTGYQFCIILAKVVNFRKGYSVVHLNARSIRNQTIGIQKELRGRNRQDQLQHFSMLSVVETW